MLGPHPPRRGQRCAASIALLGSRHGQSAQPSADRSVQRLIPCCRWTAPASRWAARHWSGPPGEGTRARTDAAPVPPPPPPRGRTRKAPAPLRSARATASYHPPFPLYEGALRLAALQAVGRLVFCWPGCVLRPLQASPPAKPQDACLLLAGRALSTTLAALTQHCQLLRRCSSSFQGSAM